MLSKRTIISLMMSVSFLLSNQLGAVSFTAAWQKTKSYLNVAYKEIKTRPIATFAALGLVVSFSGWYESYRLRKQQDGLGRLHIDNYDFLVSKLNKECQEQMFEANKNVNQYRLYGGFLSGKPLTLIPPESRLICSINRPNFYTQNCSSPEITNKLTSLYNSQDEASRFSFKWLIVAMAGYFFALNEDVLNNKKRKKLDDRFFKEINEIFEEINLNTLAFVIVTSAVLSL